MLQDTQSAVLLGTIGFAPQQTPVIVKQIPYRRDVPASAARLMPYGARSCFWGTFRPAASGPLYGLHLFKKDPRQGREDQGSPNKQEFTLDIFQFQSALSSFRHIKRLPVHYPSLVWGVSSFSARWVWLHPQSRRGLVLQFDIWTEGDHGEVGENVYLSFPEGLKGQTAVQALQFGAWRASDYSGESNRFVLGSNKLTEIFVSLSPSTGELSPGQIESDYQFTLQWNNKRGIFWPTSKARRVLKNFSYLHSVVEAW